MIASTMESVRGNKINDVNYVNLKKGTVNEKHKNVRCNKCDKLGHIAVNCRVNRKKKSAKQSNATQPANNDEKKSTKNDEKKTKLELTCFNCGTKGHYASDCRKKKATSRSTTVNLAEVNMIEIVSKPPVHEQSLSSKWNWYVSNPGRPASWDKYDKFILNYCIHYGNFCEDCLALNSNVDGSESHPRRCRQHIDNWCHKGCGVFWQDETDGSDRDIGITLEQLPAEVRRVIEKRNRAMELLERFNDRCRAIRASRGIPELTQAQRDGRWVDDEPTSDYEEPTSDHDDASAYTIELFSSDTNNNLKLLAVHALVEGTDPGWRKGHSSQEIEMRCGLDTGATHSIMSHKAAIKHNLVILKSDKLFKTADGVVRSVIGKTKNLKVNVQGSHAFISFIVIEHNDHDVLLGLDWFNQTGAGFYPGNKVLKFPHKPEEYFEASAEEVDTEINERTVDLCLAEDPDEIDIDSDVSWELADTKFDIRPQAKLTKQQERIFMDTTKRLEKYVAKSIMELGKCKIFKHKIRTIDEEPIYIPAYRKSQAEQEEINRQVNEMFRAGIIRRSKSPWSSPIILVPKPNNTKRLCIDFRRLNKKTIQQTWPIPRILDILDRLNGSRYFTALDLKSGFWQVEMDEESIPKTAFSCRNSHWEFVRLPFGLKNAPFEFSRIMFMVLGDLDFVEVYLDDITIHSKTFEDHMKHIETVMNKLDAANLKINLEKCSWCAEEITILGHVVSFNKIMMDPRKIEVVKEWKTPKNVKQVQQFLGLANYYRRHVLNFSKHAAPLYNLLKKETLFIFGPECEKAFEEIKGLLTSNPVLRPPDFKREFFLYTDASGYCLGAVLGQKDEEGREYVVSYGSRMLKGAEVHYSITEKECLGVVWAVKHFRVYLYGRKFTIITDHSSLLWLMNIKDPNGRLARWSLYLQTLEYTIVHRAGRIHSNVDVLSRPVLSVTLAQANFDEVESESNEKGLDIFENEPLLHFIKFGKHLPGTSKSVVKRVQQASPFYRFNGKEITYRKKKDSVWRIIPSPELRVDIIEKAHLIGHFQLQSTYARLEPDYYWRKMKDQIVQVIRNCEMCARNEKKAALMKYSIGGNIRSSRRRIGFWFT